MRPYSVRVECMSSTTCFPTYVALEWIRVIVPSFVNGVIYLLFKPFATVHTMQSIVSRCSDLNSLMSILAYTLDLSRVQRISTSPHFLD